MIVVIPRCNFTPQTTSLSTCRSPHHNNKSPSMSSPTSQVLEMVELLDIVLSNLAMRDLLAAQRVNYLWHQVIAKSRKMQRTKCLLPDTSAELSNPQSNPLYLQRFVQQACLHALRQVNPTFPFLGMDRFVVDRVKSFEESEASWRKMLLFQPRVPLVLVRPMSAHFENRDTFYLSNEAGVTMADVVIFFEEMAKAAGDAVELLSATATRKMVWSVMPVARRELQW